MLFCLRRCEDKDGHRLACVSVCLCVRWCACHRLRTTPEPDMFTTEGRPGLNTLLLSPSLAALFCIYTRRDTCYSSLRSVSSLLAALKLRLGCRWRSLSMRTGREILFTAGKHLGNVFAVLHYMLTSVGNQILTRGAKESAKSSSLSASC